MESTEFTAKKRPARAKRSSPPPTGRDSSGRGSGSGNTMRLCVPADGKAGDVLRINTSTGRVLSVAVPAGLKAGDSFEVRVPPSAAPPPTTSPLARKTSSLAMQRKASSDALTRKFRYTLWFCVHLIVPQLDGSFALTHRDKPSQRQYSDYRS